MSGSQHQTALKKVSEARMPMPISDNLYQRALALAARDPESKAVIEGLLKPLGLKLEPVADAEHLLDHADLVFHAMSFILPERRKAELGLFQDHLVAVSGKKLLAKGDWKDYNLAIILAVPEKARKTWNLVLMSRSGSTVNQPIVMQITDVSADKHVDKAKAASTTLRTELLSSIAPHVADVAEDDDAVVVPAHYGSREGTLYLLQEYMFYGFRKPVLLIPLNQIESVSYTVVTRLTFNIVVQIAGEIEYEFAMIPHDDYEEISTYVASHGLNDASMAAERQAKRAKTEPTELQKAAESGKLNQATDGAGDDDLSDSEADAGPDFIAPPDQNSDGSEVGGESEDESEREDDEDGSEDIGSEDEEDEEEEDEEEERSDEVTFD